ncbi:hypothetical protein C0992_008793 [Termitomyces sp. T32_za158]|nr:hypothetical protein C0992_008793 [Termitomyces sp. T32_za158]
MHASCQERFKHSIPPQQAIDLFRPAYPETAGGDIHPSNCRINITFRFYRPDFSPSSTPRCKCGVPTILRPDMKNRSDGRNDRYWWACYAGAQNDGKGCNFWKVMDMKAEGRGSGWKGVFIGLFAGVQHKLNLERERKRDGEPTATVTTTVIATSTAISTQTTSFTTTSTATSPAPSPTTPPKEVTGGWLRTHPLPADKSSYGNFEAVAERNRQIIQGILESKPNKSSFERDPDQQIMLKLRDFYTSCLNEDTLDEIGTIPLLDFVKELRKKFHGDPNNASSKKSSVEALFSFEIEGDVGRDPNDMTLWFNQPSLGLPSKEYYEDKAILGVYQGVVERLLLALSKEDEDELKHVQGTFDTVQLQETNVWPPWPWPPWDEDDDDNGGDKKPMNRSQRARKLSQKIVKLEKSLAKASLDLDVLLQNPIATYNPLPLSNLTDTLRQIDFPEYFAAFTPRNFPSVVIQTYPAYASSLNKILRKTSADVVEAYLIVRAALALAPYLGSSTEAWQAQRTLYELLNGIKRGVVGDRSEYCIARVEESLGFAVGRYFVNDTFAGDSKEKGTKVITEIVKAFKASLPHIEWMDEKSGKAAAEKADAIRVKVRTSGENIGDTGLIQAYRAWKAQNDTGRELLLPGMEYTREQLFFISFARIWARAMKTAAAVQRIRTDPHSPSRFRVDGTVYNIPEFAKAFNCSKKAKVRVSSDIGMVLFTG